AGRPCIPCEELAAINHDISNAESFATMNATRILLYGPSPEIVSTIFTNFLPANVALDYCIRRAGKVVCTTPLLLGAVCTAWRAIVWSTPLLWTSIFNAGIAKKVMDSFEPYAHRWYHLALRIRRLACYLQPRLAHASMLRTLKIKAASLTEEINFGQLPKLRKLSMDHLRVDKLLNMHWHQLGAVNVGIPSIDMCYDLFSKASFMTSVTFDLRPCESIYTTRNVRSQCTLKSLELDMTHTEIEIEPHLIPFLAEIPSLDTLKFIRCTGAQRNATHSVDPLLTWLSETAQTQETATSQTTFLPSLKKLHLTNMELSYDRVLDVLRAHSEEPQAYGAPIHRGVRQAPNTRLLRSLYIQVPVWGEEYKVIELDVAQQLQRAIEGGFKVAIVADSHHGGLADIIDKSLHPAET
ncbi:hypothetical protein BJ912DRAFT_970833, partial [Pholiota molesta]